MMRQLPMALAGVAGILLLLLGSTPPGTWSEGAQPARRAPEFPTSDPSHWINSPPLSMKELRGRVVVLEVWTFG